MPVVVYLYCFISNPAETDDYAEIVDEEDTYTMPSSKLFFNYPGRT